MKVTDAKGAPVTGVGWEKADLFFLLDALRHGTTIEEVAGFLGKPVDEVRAKAHQFDENLINDDTTLVPRPPG
jgi:hypothetical protein